MHAYLQEGLASYMKMYTSTIAYMLMDLLSLCKEEVGIFLSRLFELWHKNAIEHSCLRPNFVTLVLNASAKVSIPPEIKEITECPKISFNNYLPYGTTCSLANFR